ncbi:helix-turn-helix domain-containing protein [Stenotrophomonas maltophilia]|nr:helix-turn-helix domain-containing protein [Stenotrophomonas maltophilia]NMT72888.1 helix-turn-helix domain-containing protein [Stenotrophomonas maltophilia]
MALSGKLMTLAEAAERSACSAKTIRRAIDAGQLVAVRLGGSARSDRIHPADLEDWWERSRQTTAPAPAMSGVTTAPTSPTSADERVAAMLAPIRTRTNGSRMSVEIRTPQRPRSSRS